MKKVQLVNPWSGACPPDMNLTWDDIKIWESEHVHPNTRSAWISEAMKAFQDGDGKTLGSMIIGS